MGVLQEVRWEYRTVSVSRDGWLTGEEIDGQLNSLGKKGFRILEGVSGPGEFVLERKYYVTRRDEE